MTNKKSTKKMGRPKLPKGHAKGKIVPVRLTDADVKLLAEAVDKSEYKTLSDWMRHTLREAAERGTNNVPKQ